MVMLRHIGWLAFVLGVCCAVFLGLPWYVMGADAVKNVRYMTTSVVGSAAELLVYGTAVKF